MLLKLHKITLEELSFYQPVVVGGEHVVLASWKPLSKHNSAPQQCGGCPGPSLVSRFSVGVFLQSAPPKLPTGLLLFEQLIT